MHPDDVAALVEDEFGDLERALQARGDHSVGAARLVEATLITVELSTRAYESETVG